MYVTLLQPTPPDGPIIVEFPPSGVYSLATAKEHWARAGEHPDIVVGYEHLEILDDTRELVEALMDNGQLDLVETLLSAVFNLGKAFGR